MDIFRGWENYVEKIEKNWNESVNQDDTVVIPGDVSWAMKLEDTENDFRFLHSLPGKKVILKGNHDYWWNSLTKMNAFIEQKGFSSINFLNNNAFVADEYAICGSRGWFFETEGHSKKIINREAGRLDASIKAAEALGLEPIVFLHYPPVWAGKTCEEIIEVLKNHNISEAYHGHIHAAGSSNSVYFAEGIKFTLVSCDCLKFAPLLIKEKIFQK